MQDALVGGPSAFAGLDQVVASELTLAAGGVGGSVEVLSSNNAMLRAMRDSIELDVSGVRAMNTISESGGVALAPEQLERYEMAFGRDLGHVRIHADGRAADAAKAIEAYAFALGAHIFFGAGVFTPGTRSGDRVLSHELTHVVQSDQGRLPSSSSSGDGGQQVSSPSDPHEVEAYASENRMLDRLQQADRAIERSAAEADRAPTSDVGMSGIAVEGPSSGASTAVDSASFSADAAGLDGAGVMDSGSDLGFSGDFSAAVSSPGEAGLATDAAPAAVEGASAMRDAAGEALDTNAATSFIKNSRGAALPTAVAEKMSGLLGHDFAHVRVHTDSQAAKASEALGARAFALGTDVFFGAGEFSPESRDGDRLLAHELTHVVQHDEGRLQGSNSGDLDVSSPSDSTEREAEAAESLVDSGPSVMSEMSAPMGEMSAPSTSMEAGDMTGAAHREVAPESAPSTGVAEEYVFHIGGLEQRVKPPGNAKAGADVIFNLNWNVVPGVSLGRAVVHLDDKGKIERGTVTGTFEAGNYISGGEMTLVIGAEGAIDANVTGKYDLGWLAGEFKGTIGSAGLTASIDLATTRPIVDGEGRFVVGSATGTVSMGTDGKWSGTGEISASWAGMGTAKIKITADNDHLAGEIDFTLEKFNIGEHATVGPTAIHGTYDSTDGIVLSGRVRVTVGDFEADLEGTLELDATGGIVGASGTSGASGALPTAAPSDGAAQAPAGPAAPAAGGAPGGDAPAASSGGAPAASSGGGRRRGPASPGGDAAAAGPAAAGPATGAPAAGGAGGGAAAAGGGGAGGGSAPSGGGRGRKKGGPQAQQGGNSAAAEKAKVPSVPNTALLPGGGKLSLPTGAKLGGKGTLRQTKPIEVDGFTITGGELSIGLEENTFTKVDSTFDYAFDKYTGHIEATIDVATGLVQGKGTCKLSEEFTVGDSGVIIKKADGQLTIVDNKPKLLTGTIEIEVPYEQQPTFSVVGSSLVYDFDKSELGGTVTATTLRPLTLGDVGKMHAVIDEGASATGNVAANKLVNIDGGLTYKVIEPAGEVGAGTIKVDFTPEGSLNADADFKLTCEYGLPERAKGPLFMQEGSTFRVTVKAGALEKAALEDVKFEFANPTGEGGIKGDLQGTYTFADGLVTGTGHAEVAVPWTIRGESWGYVTFTEGGSLDIGVTKSELTKMEGNFPYVANVKAGDKILDLEGELKGAYDKKSDKFGGELNGKLKNALEFNLEGGALLKILPDATAKIMVKKSEFDSVELNFDCEYYKAGESKAFLGGKIEKATYDLKSGDIRFDGKVTLLQNIEKQSEDGKWKLRAVEGSSVNVEVRKSALTKIGGDIKFEIDDTEGKLFEGDLKGLQFDVQQFKFSGNLDLRTARDINFPHKKDEGDVAAYRLNVKKGSKINGRIEKNTVASVGAELDFSVDFLQVTEAIQGVVKGNWDLKSDEFTGNSDIEVKKPFPLAGGQQKDASGKELESFIIGVLPGSKVNLAVDKNKLKRAKVHLLVGMEYNNEDVATGTLDGQYKVGGDEEGFSGDATVNVMKRFDWAEGKGDYKYIIEQGTSAKATMAQSKITAATGTFILVGNSKSRKKDEWKIDVGGSWAPATGIGGSGSIHILEDIVVGKGDTYTAVLLAKSEATGTVEADEFKQLTGMVGVRLDEGTTPKIGAKFQVTYVAGTESKITATGEVKTLDEFKIGGLGDFKFVLAKDSVAQGSVKENELESITGDVTINVKRGESPFGVAHLNGTYTHGKEPSFTGEGTFDVTAPETDLGINLPGGMTVFLMAGAGMKAKVAKNELETLSAGVPLVIKKNGSPFIDVKLEGTYFHKEKKFTGKASGSLIPRLQVGSTTASGYSFWVEPSTGVEAEFTEGGIKSLGGTLKATVEDGAPFVAAEGKALWTFGAAETDGKLDVKGSLKVVRTKLLTPEGSEWGVSIAKDSGGEITVEQNEIKELKGNLSLLVSRNAKDFAEVTFSNGSWTKDTGFNGEGAAKLKVPEFLMATISPYTFTLLEGSGGDVKIAKSAVTNIKGQIKIGINKGAEKFMAGELKGDYTFGAKEGEGDFSGNGSIAVVNPQKLAAVGDKETLWLIQGSGVDVNITKNDLDKVGGNLTLSLREGESNEYLTCALKGTYDIKGNTGFTGDGSVDIKRRKELFGLKDYHFLLDKGGGAKAKIVKNEITEVSGNVPFVVQDGVGDLVLGQAEGKYVAATGKFSGKGTLKLGRPLTYDVGGGLQLKLNSASGSGEVVDSKLEKLSGSLNVELWKDGKGIVSLVGTGDYDAVNNKIVKASGTGTLMQPISLLDGNVVIDKVSGNVVVEDNKLVEAGGKGTITLPKLGKGNNVTGTFALKWSNRTGKDVYEGTGKINFALLDDPSKGRKMAGEVDVTYRSDDTFDAHGKVRYDMNEMIGGDIDITMDQTFNPVVNASMSVKGQLVEGRDLFSLNTDIIPPTPVPLFAGIQLVFGAKAGMALKMRPLTFETVLKIMNWKPKEGGVPDFAADLTMNWGMDFDAMVAAYAKLSGGIEGIASIGAGIRGQVDLHAPLSINPHAEIHGGKDTFGGSLGVGISLAPTVKLSIIPFVDAGVLGKNYSHDFPGAEMNLGEIFKFEWGTTYNFGDQPSKVAKAPEAQPVPAPVVDTSKKLETAPTLGSNSASGAGPAKKGAPQLESGKDIASKQGMAKKGAKPSGMDALTEKIDTIKIIAEGLGALGYLVGLLVNVVKALSFGLIGLGLYLIYAALFEGFSFSRVGDAIRKLGKAIAKAYEILQPMMPEWLTDLIEVIKNPPGLLDLFSGDDKARAATREGKIFTEPKDAQARGKLQAECVYQMLDGWTGEDDQECILICLQRGDLNAILGRVSVGWILDDLDGYEDDEARKIFRQRGLM